MRIAINGIGVAGPTLAFWLIKWGHEVLLVEKSPQVRRGGYIIDFWGVGYDIAEKMGLIPRISELGYQVKEVQFLDHRGRKKGGFSVDAISHITRGRFTSLQRSDLSTTIYDAIAGKAETMFGVLISGVENRGDQVRISFDKAKPREVDLLIGADGLHSRVRRLVFGPQEKFEVSLGYYVAAFQIKGYQPRDELAYVSHGAPGRQVSRFSMRDDKTLFLFVFRAEAMTGGPPSDKQEQMLALRNAFADVGWECPQILKLMDNTDNIYFDRVSQIKMEHWTSGRTALIGDAAACVSLLAGEGAGLAMAEAYVLAGELSRAGTDHRTAFMRYEQLLMSFLKRKQKSAAKFASTFAPQTSFGIRFRNLATRLLGIPFLADFMIGRDLRDDIALPHYGWNNKCEERES